MAKNYSVRYIPGQSAKRIFPASKYTLNDNLSIEGCPYSQKVMN